MPVYRLNQRPVFPPAHLAEKDNGLLAVGGDLSLKRLLKAYSEGIFPWYSPGDPLLWWSPDPRAVLFPQEFHFSKRNRRYLQKSGFVRVRDTAFAEVIRACAENPRRHETGTWITPEMQTAYIELHRAGYAHSFEVFLQDKLVGGLYGLALGRCFFAESMFSTVDHASKAALFDLVSRALQLNFHFIDVQFLTSHLQQFGVREISRRKYLLRLQRALKKSTRRGLWTERQIKSGQNL